MLLGAIEWGRAITSPLSKVVLSTEGLTHRLQNIKHEVPAEIGKFDEGLASVVPAELRVLHGYTLTKEITFRDVCQAACFRRIISPSHRQS